ncbi:MAG: endonuclease/exonuclease/phosphatase family protein [Opitutaceae bacterium]|nr:endonuclease/exonuclease/phosphatase family protein [Opitutaceae bacterium]
MRRFISAVILGLLLVLPVAARPFIVLVYNVENLFDADAKALFEDYQPARYSRQHVLTKMENITRVVAKFENGRGPDIILFQEIEQDQSNAEAVPDYAAILQRYAGTTIGEMLGAKFSAEIADLPAEALLLKTFADHGLTGYNVARGENVRGAGSRHALAQKCVVFTRFPVKRAVSHPTLDARAIQEVEVEVDGAPLYLFNNHWKSGAGNADTEKARIANARTLRTRLDEILQADPHADIIIGGDFNSQYNQKTRYRQMKETGLNDVLGSQGNELAVRGPKRDLYNLWFELPSEERGSDTYQGEWGTLMQLIISRGLYDYRGVQYVDDSFGVAKIPGLNLDDKGLPIRWSFDGPAGSGFSDHLPVYAKFLTVTNNQPSRYISLRSPSEDTGLASVNKIDYGKIDLAKVALTFDQLPPGQSFRHDAFKGKIIRVVGEVGRSSRLTVVVRNDVYDIWSYDRDLLTKLRAKWKEGETARFYGEINQYKGRWQFIIRDASWVK